MMYLMQVHIAIPDFNASQVILENNSPQLASEIERFNPRFAD
ncbi:hypothetical protein [Dolichospermum compactum]|nr:hypothetical protein [Dolichospermum compactum]